MPAPRSGKRFVIWTDALLYRQNGKARSRTDSSNLAALPVRDLRLVRRAWRSSSRQGHHHRCRPSSTRSTTRVNHPKPIEGPEPQLPRGQKAAEGADPWPTDKAAEQIWQALAFPPRRPALRASPRASPRASGDAGGIPAPLAISPGGRRPPDRFWPRRSCLPRRSICNQLKPSPQRPDCKLGLERVL